MKKMMRKLIAALMAVCCVPVTAVAANAEGIDWYWGIATSDAFEELTPVNSYGWHGYYTGITEVNFLRNPDSVYPTVISAAPRENVVRFILRDESDVDAMIDVMEQYFPDMSDSFDNDAWRYDDCTLYKLYEGISDREQGKVYDLYLHSDLENKAEIESGLLLGMAKEHLITAFYGCGSTANYMTGFLQEDVLTGYTDSYYEWVGTVNGRDKYEEYTIDWDAVQSYLDEHHAGCQVEQYQGTGVNGEECTLHRINTPDSMSFKDKFELACELYGSFHLNFTALYPESSGGNLLGHNSLENKGDVTLDCELDIMDVIAANKYILGVDTLCDTAKKNADVSGDGTPDASDALSIMKEVVGVTTDFME